MKEVIDVFGCGKFDLIVCYCHCYAHMLRDGHLNGEVTEIDELLLEEGEEYTAAGGY